AHGVDAGGVDVLVVEEHGAVDLGARDDLMHPVQRAQHRCLATAGRADERGDAAGEDGQRHIRDRMKRSVVDVDVFHVQALSHVALLAYDFLGAKSIETTLAPILITAIIRIRVNAAPHNRSVGTGFPPAPADVWSYIIPGSVPIKPRKTSRLIACE